MMRRLLDPADLDWIEPELRKIGALCGGPVAERAEVTDKHPPELLKFDRWGDPLDEVRHHPGALATKRDLWEAGLSGPRLHREARRRGRHLPETVPTALNYRFEQPSPSHPLPEYPSENGRQTCAVVSICGHLYCLRLRGIGMIDMRQSAQTDT